MQQLSLPANHIPIVTASDDNYAVPLFVMLFSLLENRKSGHPIAVYVISNDFSEENKTTLARLFADYPNAYHAFVSLDESYFEQLETHSDYISPVTYYRFALPDLFGEKVKKVLYLDCDMIVQEDIVKLWEIDLGNKICGGVPEKFAEMPQKPWSVNQVRKMQIPLDSPYYNVGVLSINLALWRQHNISERCIRLMVDEPERIAMDDQDAINIALVGKWHQLPFRWNIITAWFLDFVQEALRGKNIFEQALHPAIIHFTSAKKPWRLDIQHFHQASFRRYHQQFSERYVWPFFKEKNTTQAGVSLISICYDQQIPFLKKAVESWLKEEKIDEIVLLDATTENQIPGILSQIETQRIRYIQLEESDAFTHGMLLNIGLRLARYDQLLIVESDCLLYDLLLEEHELNENSFFSLQVWKYWFLKRLYFLPSCLVNRTHLLEINGFHEALGKDEVLPYAFDQLKLLGLREKLLHFNSIYAQDQDRMLMQNYLPIEELHFPPLNEKEVMELQGIKNEVINEVNPWNLKSQFQPIQWLQLTENGCKARVAADFVHPKLIETARLTIAQRSFVRWFEAHFPQVKRYHSWLEEVDLAVFSKSFFHPDNLLELLQLHTSHDEVPTSPKVPNTREIALQDRIDAMEGSYAWRIGSFITGIAYRILKPFLSKQKEKNHVQ